jgi:purine-binding chemotaxis protein CheW
MAERAPEAASIAFDWTKAHAQLDRFKEKLRSLRDPSPDEIQRILRERARILATPDKAGITDQPVQFVVFRAGDEHYAIEAEQVLGVAAVGKPTPLPGVPGFYLGLINYRGMVYPLIDPRPLIGAPIATALSPTNAILAVSDHNIAALAADAIEDFVEIDRNAIAPFREAAARHTALRGLILNSVIIIDIQQLLQDARLVVNDQPSTRGRSDGGQHESGTK